MDNKKTQILLAPMAGAGDRAFREICAEFGADGFFTEMISSKAVLFQDKKSFELAVIGDSATPCRIQIFGHEKDIMALSAKKLYEKFKPSGFDINFGCPVPKITKGGDGSKLLNNPSLCAEILYEVKKSVPVPVSAKIRLGWDRENITAPIVASLLEQAGADMISVHGRTRSEMYQAGKVTPLEIRKIKERVAIPVIANGDISDFSSFSELMEQSGADGAMIGRAAIGKPWIFAEIKAKLANREFSEPDKKEVMRNHLLLASKYKPETYIYEMRMHMAHYLKGFRGAAKFRNEVSSASSLDDYLRIIDELV